MENNSYPASELIVMPGEQVYHLRLSPGEVAPFVFTVGDPGRVDMVSRYFDSTVVRRQHREFVTHTGYVGKKMVTVVSTGIGTGNVEIVLMELDALFNIDLTLRTGKSSHVALDIVRLGTSGALRPQVPVGSLLASEFAYGLDSLMAFYQLPQNDQEATACVDLQEQLGLPFLPYSASACPALMARFAGGMAVGDTATLPGFYAPQGRKLRYSLKNEGFMAALLAFRAAGRPIANFEMETAAIYALARVLGHRALSLNAVLANRADGTFDQDPDKTVDRLIQHALGNI